MQSFDPIRSATEMVKHIRTSGVLSSLLWILPFLVGSLVIVSFTGNTTVQIFFMLAIAVVLAVLIISFLYILFFKDPKLLQSEDQMFRMKALELLGDQQHAFEDFRDSPEENNPALPNPGNVLIPKMPPKKPSKRRS